MTSESKPIRPRSVLVADDEMYLRLAHDANDVRLLADADALIVPYSVEPALNTGTVDSVRTLLRESGQLVPKSLLIKNPYQAESYESADDAIGTFAITKYHAFANVARLLGATEVRFIEARVELEDTNWQAKVAAMLPSGGGEAEAAREVSKKLEDRLSGHLTFGGGPADAVAADDYLQQSRLSRDPQLRSLVDMRTGVNLLNGYEFTLSGTRESSSNLTSALHIANAGPVKAVEIGAKFAMMAKAIRNVEIKTEIVF